MISFYQLTRALDKERERIRYTEFDTVFVKGIMQGLRLAASIARTLYEDTKHQKAPNPFGFKRHSRKAA